MTLVELTFAAVVMMGAIITMLAMFDTAIDILRFTTARSLSTQLANEALEDMRALDYEQAFLSEPTTWPVDPDLDTGFDPPKFKDIDDSSATTWRSLATTPTASAIQFEETVERQRITFVIRKYVMLVDDGANSDAFKRLVVKVKWLETSIDGETVVATNFSKEDEGESRPLAKILGIRSTNYSYILDAPFETTLGVDNSIRGPGGGA